MVGEEMDDKEKTIRRINTRKWKGIWEKGGKKVKVRKGRGMKYCYDLTNSD
jgi:hypothetical protein